MANGNGNYQHQNRPATQVQQPTPKVDTVLAVQPPKPSDLQDEIDKSAGATELAVCATVKEEFLVNVATSLQQVIIGKKSPLEVKVALRKWFTSLSLVEQHENQQDLVEAARFISLQVEDVVNEAPVLFMI